jgi:hypothetical protein
MASMTRSFSGAGGEANPFRRVKQLDQKRLEVKVLRYLMRYFDLLYANLPQRTWQTGEGLDRTPYAGLMERRFRTCARNTKTAMVRAVSTARWSLIPGRSKANTC